jgi:transcriptional regulator with XRE-family HTH domain
MKKNMKPKKVPESYSDVNQKLLQIGERVRKVRKEKYSNYESFSEASNINKVTLNRIELGKSVSMKLFINVLLKLEISSLEDFFQGI